MGLYKPRQESHQSSSQAHSSLFFTHSFSLLFLSITPEKMKGFSLSLVLIIFILICSSSFEICNARRGKHWRQKRSSAASLSKKKGKSGGSSSQHHHKGPKSSHSHAPAPSLAPEAPVPPVLAPAPKLKQPGNGDGNSTIFNVVNFGAKGDGATDDTKVTVLCTIHLHTSMS